MERYTPKSPELINRRLPDNMIMTWQRGDFSIVGILEKPIIDHYPHGVGRIVAELRDETAQLDEKKMQQMFHKCIGMAQADRHKWYQFYRMDREADVEENNNNRPFIMNTSPRYFSGSEVKDIQYEGYLYHSDMSVIKRY